MTVGPAAVASFTLAVCIGCSAEDMPRELRPDRAAYLETDSMGVVPKATEIELQAPRELVENSAATLSPTQPGVFFTINDSGNEPLLFAFDSTGAGRGVWRVSGATNVDWEAASTGPCSASGANGAGAGPAATTCVYIGDTGDNDAKRPSRVIYKVVEPTAANGGALGDAPAAALRYRYEDGPHDVEAMYVAPNGDIYLITKRRLVGAGRRLRPALVFRLSAGAWNQPTPAVAALVDSLPIVPGSAPLRQITDAALSPDGRFLAVRTYAQVYVFAADAATGRVRAAASPSVCNIIALVRGPGEGVAWFGRTGQLLLTTEGRQAPMFAVGCPLPAGEQ